MKILLQSLLHSLLYLWQLPQNILGLIMIRVLNAKRRIFNTACGCIEWYCFIRNSKFSKFISGASLGNYIILHNEDENTIKHEYGHCIQSRFLGWLYLPVVGVYSAVFCNLWARWFNKDNKWYYSRWCEAWADKLGGVRRG